jgi:hypothetical protein
VYADLRGRKRAFLISATLYGLGYGLILLLTPPLRCSARWSFAAWGRAFSSGSIEALALDEAEGGDGALVPPRRGFRFGKRRARGGFPRGRFAGRRLGAYSPT